MTTWARRGGAEVFWLERITHNAGSTVIDGYTHTPFDPLREAMLRLDHGLPGVRPGPAVDKRHRAGHGARAKGQRLLEGSGSRRRESKQVAATGTNGNLQERDGPVASNAGPDSLTFPQVPATHGARHEIARRYLVAAARGERNEALAVGLARAVLDAPEARLALAVLSGGEHVHMRAIELAARLLRADTRATRGEETA